VMLNSRPIASTRSEADMCAAALHGCTYKEAPAEYIELSLDSDVLDALRATGRDWETHFNAILRAWLRSNSPVSVA